MRVIFLFILFCFLHPTLEAQNPIRNYFFVQGSLLTGSKSSFYTSTIYDNSTDRSTIVGFGFGFGNKWYFTNGKDYRSGFIANWLMGEAFSQLNAFGGLNFNLAAVQPGITNTWLVKDRSALEINLTGGYAPQLLEGDFFHGYQISSEIKLHSRRTLYGLAYVYGKSHRSYGYFQQSNFYHLLRLTIGLSNKPSDEQ